MTFDSDGSAHSPAELLVSIRERIVAYKQDLLRQLLDQQTALTKTDRSDNRISDTKRSGSEQVVELDEVDEKRRDVKRLKTMNSETRLSNGFPKTSMPHINGRREEESSVDKAIAQESPRSKKRRLSDGNVIERERRMSFQEEDADQRDRLPPARRVMRTSVPSRKYLESEQQVREYSATAGSQPVLLSSSASPRGIMDSTGLDSQDGLQQSSHQPQDHRVTVEQIQVDFEQKLRDSIRMNHEVRTRSLTMTRKRQLPRLATPFRQKSHWDFLLEEMKWMATDFAQERNWRRVMQYHLAKDVIVEKNAEKVRQEKEHRQAAREIALQISAFWRTMERIAARSRVRFESGIGAVAGAKIGESGQDAVEIADDTSKQKNDVDSTMDSDANGDSSVHDLKYKKIDVSAFSDDDSRLELAKAKLKRIVTVGKLARDAMKSGSVEDSDNESREAALREIQTWSLAGHCRRTTAVLAAFQILALRWMLELYTAGLNMLVNDQLGMGKSATIAAFLKLIELVAKPYNTPSSPTSGTGDGHLDGPHLIIVAEDELHKWQYYLRTWHPNRKIELYTGEASHRAKLRRDWKRKAQSGADKKGDFLNEDDEDSDLEDDGVSGHLFCVLCPVNMFAKDQDSFVNFTDWQMVVVENEYDKLFEDSKLIAALKKIPQKKCRILCNGHSIENWKNIDLRYHYGEFLVSDAISQDPAEWNTDIWTRHLLVEKASVTEAMQACGKPTSSLASLWKSSQLDHQQHVSALLLALYCLGLRRVRSEVEPELGKIEEQSLSCQLSSSQMTQYRNAISGFAASQSSMSDREERLEVWLQLFLRLRMICNCVDLVNDLEKLGHADMRLIKSCSAKLEALESLLTRIVGKEEKRVVIYCQFDPMFPILEMFLALLDISFVRVTGTATMQRRALYHFAERTAVKVALVSTRLSTAEGTRAVSLYGADVIVVLDSDWNALCDAKLRASWAKLAVTKEIIPVYRLHCEHTIEASLLRVGACLSEKVFGEMSPQELLVVPADISLGNNSIEKPSWWTSSASSGASAIISVANISAIAHQAEQQERYCGDECELEQPLVVLNVDLDADEHLLLANTDELTPVEWYAVNYVHEMTDKKRTHQDDMGRDDELASSGWNDAYYQSETRSFEEIAAVESDESWQTGDAQKQLFYDSDRFPASNGIDEAQIENLFDQLRLKGMEAFYNIYKPPQPPETPHQDIQMTTDAGTTDGNQMLFHVSYRVPAPPPPPQPTKLKTEQLNTFQPPDSLKPTKSKKQRVANAGAAGAASARAGYPATGAAGVKRKLDQHLAGSIGVKSSMKEQRMDLDGIPIPDVAELEDDDFWGDTNLDALDSASWDDASVLSGILGSSIDPLSSGSTLGNSTPAGAGQGATTSGSQRASSSKKLKGANAAGATGTGNRARKGSMSSTDAGRDGWSAQDDLVLKKLFELYGSNWSLIAQVFNSTTAVSRFFCKKRSPRQCYDRYGKIISGSLASSSHAASGSLPGAKESKTAASGPSIKQQKAAAALLTPAVLDARIGLPGEEMLIIFPKRHSLPGLPPPSIINVPSLVEMSMKKKKLQKQQTPGPDLGKGGLDDLKSIRSSFDAIIHCMKRKAAPPPIPIPVPSPTSAPSDFATTTTPLTSPGVNSTSFTPTAKATKAAVSPLTTTSKAVTVVSPPHKSHLDMISLLPNVALAPDEVIKRSKEAAAVAVQAAAAVASVGRDVSPLSTTGDAVLSSGFSSSSAGMSRKPHTPSLNGGGITSGTPATTPSRVAVGMTGNAIPPTISGANLTTTGAATSTPTAATSWGDISGLHQNLAHNVGNSMDLSTGANAVPARTSPTMNAVDSGAGSNSNRSSGGVGEMGGGGRNPMPVTTSTLLHVLDRMPEIKNKIQAILNRNDCSEAQKVAMIARLLSNTNAINNPAVMAAAPPVNDTNTLTLMSTSPSIQPLNTTASTVPNPSSTTDSTSLATTASTSLGDGNSTGSNGTNCSVGNATVVIDTENPLPMPLLLATSPSNIESSTDPSYSSSTTKP